MRVLARTLRACVCLRVPCGHARACAYPSGMRVLRVPLGHACACAYPAGMRTPARTPRACVCLRVLLGHARACAYPSGMRAPVAKCTRPRMQPPMQHRRRGMHTPARKRTRRPASCARPHARAHLHAAVLKLLGQPLWQLLHAPGCRILWHLLQAPGCRMRDLARVVGHAPGEAAQLALPVGLAHRLDQLAGGLLQRLCCRGSRAPQVEANAELAAARAVRARRGLSGRSGLKGARE
eukprot:355871-Chlamydomonas_euryale.AAC.12